MSRRFTLVLTGNKWSIINASEPSELTRMDSDLLADLPSDLETAEQPPTQPIEEMSATPAAPVEESVAPTLDASPPPPVEEKVSPPAEVKAAASAEEKVASPAEERSSVAASTPASVSAVSESPRVEVSAATVARMMGIASTSDLRVIEGRIDLLTSKVAAILTKVDRCLSMFSSIPTASDIGRLEVQVAAVKTMMKEILDAAGAPVSPVKEQADRELALEQSRKLREGIKSNSES